MGLVDRMYFVFVLFKTLALTVGFIKDETWMPFACWLLCLAFALGHHFTNHFFSQKAVAPITLSNIQVTIGQQWVLTFGNIFSAVTVLLLPISVTEASNQLFWCAVDKFRDPQTNTLTIDDDQRDHIFEPLLSPWWLSEIFHRFRFLQIISALACLIPIIANPSLTVRVQPVAQSCNISTVNLATSKIAITDQSGATIGAVVGAVDVAVKTLISGYLTPPIQCSNCFYNTTFWAPALNCTSSTTDERNLFPRDDPPGQTVFWNSTLIKEPGAYVLTVRSKQGNQGNANTVPPNFISCSVLNGTYNVQVNHNTSTGVIASVDKLLPYTSTITGNSIQGQPLDALLFALSTAIEGQLSISNTDNALIQRNLIGYSLLGSLVDATWHLNGNLSELMQGLMQNVSISLLARNIGGTAGFSTLSDVTSTCNVNTSVYIYNLKRLWLPYSIALGISLFFMIVGFCMAVNNPRNFSFSDLSTYLKTT